MCSNCTGDYEDPDATAPEIMEIDVRDSQIPNVKRRVAAWLAIAGMMWGFGLAYVYPWIHRLLQ